METSLLETVDDEWVRFMRDSAAPVSESTEEISLVSGYMRKRPNGVSAIRNAIAEAYERSNGEPVLERQPSAAVSLPICIEGSAPECGKLHISTKTKVLFLNCEIDTLKTFWSIPVIEYWQPIEGVVKKQIKITSNSKDEFAQMQTRLQECGHRYTEMVIKTVDTCVNDATSVALGNGMMPRTGGTEPKVSTAPKPKFKDDRKITIGTSKKDIMNCRGKQKKAFMNCFAIIIRFRYEGEFREAHVKVFNTGKLEIPGVPEDDMLEMVRLKVIEYLQPHLNLDATPLDYVRKDGKDSDEDVLINSGFHCGFCINQKAFYSILRSEKYGIETSYDSCHYPGIRCKYYYRNYLPEKHEGQNGRIGADDNGIKLSQLEMCKKYTCVSFMIFSTGNCLVVGNCSKAVLLHVFEFMKRLLEEEYGRIYLPTPDTVVKLKKKKQRKKTVVMNSAYYSSISK
jgi:hypothetical protein